MAAEFDLKKVTRDWRSRDGGGLLLSLRAQPKTDNALTVVSEALSAAYEQAQRPTSFDVGEVRGGEPVWTGRDWMLCLDECDSEQALQMFASTLVEELNHGGWSGKIGLAKSSNQMPYEWTHAVPAYAAGIVLPLPAGTYDPASRTSAMGRGWLVESSITERVISLALEFLRHYDPQHVYIEQGLVEFRVPAEDAHQFWREGLRQRWGFAMTSAAPDSTLRRVVFDVFGHVFFMTREPRESWQVQVDRLDDVVQDLADVAEYAMLRRAFLHACMWSQFLVPHPPRPPFVDGAYIRSARHLESSHVPDAYGIQYLNPQHLANSHDLATWSVVPTGMLNRVSAPELGPWFSAAGPDDKVLHQARSDFGDVIMTRDY